MKKPRLTGLDILSHMGMIGSTLSTNSLVPRSETPQALTFQQQEFADSGRVADPDVWAKYAQVMKRPSTYETQLQLWDEMSSWDMMAAALNQIVDEVCQTDSTNPKSIWYECNNSKVEDELNNLLHHLDSETILPSQVWNVASLGNHFEKLDYTAGEGVRGMTCVHPFEVRRYWLERNRNCIGFKWKGRTPNKDDVFVMPDNRTPIQRVALSSGQNLEDLYYPWDFLHFRRMYRLRGSEHGEPLFDEAQGIYRKLRLALDQMVVHRAQIQPDRYVVNIDTQDLPPTEQLKTVQRWKQSMRNKLAFGPGSDSQTLSDPTEFRSFYNPWALDTIFYMARPKGVEHSITKLAGTTQVPDVFDIELLIDLFFSIIGMPKSWLGIGGGDQGANPPSGKALLAQDIRFLRKVKSIRKPIIAGYTWLAYFHEVLRGEDVATLNIQAKMPDIGGLEDQMKLDVVKAQADVLMQLGEIMKQYGLPREAWVELIFKRYLHLPDDIVDVFMTSLPPEIEVQQPMEGLNRINPGERVLIEVIDRTLRPHGHLIHELKMKSRALMELSEKPEVRWQKATKLIISMPELKPGDVARIEANEAFKSSVKTSDGKASINESKADANGAPQPEVRVDINGMSEPPWRRYVGMNAKARR